MASYSTSSVSYPVLSSEEFLSDPDLEARSYKITKAQIKVRLRSLVESFSVTHVDRTNYERRLHSMVKHESTKEAITALYNSWDKTIDGMTGNEELFKNFSFFCEVLRNNIDDILIVKSMVTSRTSTTITQTYGSVLRHKKFEGFKFDIDSLFSAETYDSFRSATESIVDLSERSTIVLTSDPYGAGDGDPIRTFVHECFHALLDDYARFESDGETINLFSNAEFIYTIVNWADLRNWLEKTPGIIKKITNARYYENDQILEEILVRSRAEAAMTINPTLRKLIPGYEKIFTKDFISFLEDLIIPPIDLTTNAFLIKDQIKYSMDDDWGVKDSSKNLRGNYV